MYRGPNLFLLVELLNERDNLRQLRQEEPQEQAPSADHGQVVGEGYVPGEANVPSTRMTKPLIVNTLNA